MKYTKCLLYPSSYATIKQISLFLIQGYQPIMLKWMDFQPTVKSIKRVLFSIVESVLIKSSEDNCRIPQCKQRIPQLEGLFVSYISWSPNIILLFFSRASTSCLCLKLKGEINHFTTINLTARITKLFSPRFSKTLGLVKTRV